MPPIDFWMKSGSNIKINANTIDEFYNLCVLKKITIQLVYQWVMYVDSNLNNRRHRLEQWFPTSKVWRTDKEDYKPSTCTAQS